MRCPNCNEEGLYVYDEEINLAELWAELYVQCDGCGKAFKVDCSLKVEEIEEVE